MLIIKTGVRWAIMRRAYSFFHSFIHSISIVPLQVLYYSEALPTHHGYCAGISQATVG